MSQIVELSFDEQLKKNSELKKSDVEYLKEWCQKEPHLPKICDNTLALFLHRNNYSIELTKINIDSYYTLRTHMPEFFSNRDTLNSKDLRHIFEVVHMIPLQQLTKEGYQLLLIKLLNTDASEFHFHEYVKSLLLVLDLWIYHSGTNNGHSIIYDVQDITSAHAARVNPFIMKKHIFYMQEGLPIRLKGIHFVNVTPGMEAILKISRSFMKKELLEILHIHQSLKTLQKFVPIEALPNELGGKAGPLMQLHDAQIKELEKNRSWFLEEELRSKVDETKRPGIKKSSEYFFGAEGSFKKLDLE